MLLIATLATAATAGIVGTVVATARDGYRRMPTRRA